MLPARTFVLSGVCGVGNPSSNDFMATVESPGQEAP